MASICILSTMVLVMISSTSCLYIGSEDSLSNQYPRDITIKVDYTGAADTTPVQAAVADTLAANGMSPQNQLSLDYLSISAYAQGDTLSFDYDKVENYAISDFSNLRQLYIVPLADYNRLMGTSETLNQGEMLLYAVDDNRAYDGITIEGVGTLQVKKTVQEFAGDVVNFTKFMPALFLIVPDDGSMAAIDAAQQAAYGQYCSYQQAFYGFDLALSLIHI